MMGNHRASAGQTIGQQGTIARRAPAVLLTINDQDRRSVQAGRQVFLERRMRNSFAPASSPGRVNSSAAAVIAPLEPDGDCDGSAGVQVVVCV
jgi:hypothetical protein